MSLEVAVAALLAGIVVWVLLVRRLTARPWEAETAPGVPAATGVAGVPPAKVGLWVFLGVVTSLFGLFISAYYMRMSHGLVMDHGTVQAASRGDWYPVTKPPILWLNTLVLVLSSVAMQTAKAAVAGEQRGRALLALGVGGALTWLFLAGQLVAWRQLHAPVCFVFGNPAEAFFYVLTGAHGLHLVGGLFVWGRTLTRMWARGSKLAAVRLSVELCTVYWHYLLLVWLVVFMVLLST
jgi:cytochrome c oxidase subunit III